MTHIACGYFFGSGKQNDVVSKDVGFLRNHGVNLRVNHLVPLQRSQAHSSAERISCRFDLADELPGRTADLAFLKAARTAAGR